jgi:hypothetical protein
MLPLLAACAASAPQWEKPGAAQAAMDEDLQTCRVAARLSPEPHLGGPSPTTSSAPLLERTTERDALEAQQVQKCMEGRGYSAKR